MSVERDVVGVKYSPLCDSDSVAYLAYLAVLGLVSDARVKGECAASAALCVEGLECSSAACLGKTAQVGADGGAQEPGGAVVVRDGDRGGSQRFSVCQSSTTAHRSGGVACALDAAQDFLAGVRDLARNASGSGARHGCSGCAWRGAGGRLEGVGSDAAALFASSGGTVPSVGCGGNDCAGSRAEGEVSSCCEEGKESGEESKTGGEAGGAGCVSYVASASRVAGEHGVSSRATSTDQPSRDAEAAVSSGAAYVPPFRRGPRGGVSVGRGPNYERNELARRRRREVKRAAQFGDSRGDTFGACDQAVRDQLQRTRAERLVAENQFRTFEMQRKLELARAQDFEQLKQQQRTHLLRQTELNKVQIEKAHGSLSGEVAGSVPTVVGGTVETILTSGSISPSSSISEAEIRKLHKDYLDGQAEIEKLKKDNYKLRFGVHQEDDEGRPDDSAPWDGGEDSVSQDQFSYRSGYMCTPEQREANKKLALELRGW